MLSNNHHAEQNHSVTLDLDVLRRWIGKRQSAVDMLRPQPVACMRAVLDQPAPPPRSGEALPRAWHWLFFIDAAQQRRLRRDGHAARGEFLPPVALPRRMWAGGRLEFIAPLLLGETICKQSTLIDVSLKSGRSGTLCFVTARHEYLHNAALKLIEHHRIVYRQAAIGVAADGAARSRPRRVIHRHQRHAVSPLGADLQQPPHSL